MLDGIYLFLSFIVFLFFFVAVGRALQANEVPIFLGEVKTRNNPKLAFSLVKQKCPRVREFLAEGKEMDARSLQRLTT